jgi:basic membrane protein A
MRGLARKKLDMIAAIGFSQTQAVAKVAKEFPNVKFVLIDSIAPGANVNSIMFKEQEGSYLVGVAAAMASKSKKIGFVGGMDIPLIRAFACGYSQGAKAQAEDRDHAEHGRHHQRGLERPGQGRRAGTPAIRPRRRRRVRRRRRFGHGRPADGQGKGQAGDRRRFEPELPAPGLDADLDGQARRQSRSTTRSCRSRTAWKAGVTYKGLKEGGVDWVLDKDNRKVVTPEMEKRVNAVKADIINGKIKVIDYRAAAAAR